MVDFNHRQSGSLSHWSFDKKRRKNFGITKDRR